MLIIRNRQPGELYVSNKFFYSPISGAMDLAATNCGVEANYLA